MKSPVCRYFAVLGRKDKSLRRKNGEGALYTFVFSSLKKRRKKYLLRSNFWRKTVRGTKKTRRNVLVH